ncbi:unnamed protein product [Prunus armeniaca]
MNLLQRLNIAIDFACALDYLHNHCETQIVHCDLKPNNVLLDNELTGHVADFGLARFLSKLSKYGMGSEVSTYGDVYSFGILLLEMFTGKKPTDNMFSDGLNFHNFVKLNLPERVTEIADAVLFLQGGIEDTPKQRSPTAQKLEENPQETKRASVMLHLHCAPLGTFLFDKSFKLMLLFCVKKITTASCLKSLSKNTWILLGL